jgi:hypothetical protein
MATASSTMNTFFMAILFVEENQELIPKTDKK